MKTKEEFKVGKHDIRYINSTFCEYVGIDTFETSASKLHALTLPRSMTDKEIESELVPGLCTLGDIVQILDTNEYRDGKLYLFYLSSCVVCVYWLADSRGWYVSTWKRGGSEWDAGRRVFSPATGDFITQPSDTLNLETFDRRNLFAAFAMMGYIASPFREETKMDIIAQKAFRMADAMEKEASKSN